jgi:RNA polymerase sigma-70 factor (ECF subfamily)
VGLLAVLSALSGPSDEELVRRFKTGDVEAYSELVRRYQDRIYTLCLRWMRSPSLAEETAQDVFFAVWRALGDFRGDSKFSTWLFRVAINHCKNKRLYGARRHADQHEPLEGLGGDDRAPRELPDAAAGTDLQVHRSEAERLLHAGLLELEDDYRAVVILRDIDDLPYEEIAEVLDIPKGTVKSRLHRGRAQLARSLSKLLRPEDL